VESQLNNPSFYLFLRTQMLYSYLIFQPNIIFKIIILKTCPKYKFIKLTVRKLMELLWQDYLEPEVTIKFPQLKFYYIFLAPICLFLRQDFCQFFFILLNLIEILFYGHLLALSLLFLIFKDLKEEMDHNKLFFSFLLTNYFF